MQTTQDQHQQTKPVVYMVCGASGAGKSWVCNQLKDAFTYVSYDDTPKSKHVELLQQPSDKPFIYDPPIKISTFIKRNSHLFDIRPIFIIESQDTIKARIAQRGGRFTEALSKRIREMDKRNAKYGIFSGTASEVLKFLMEIR